MQTKHDTNDLTIPQLAGLLEGYYEEIVASWVGLLHGLDDSRFLDPHNTHYRERPVTELQLSARECLAALAHLFRTDRYDLLIQYADRTCRVKLEQGFDIAEVIEGHFLLREAVLPVIDRECGWDMGHGDSLLMLSKLETALHWLVIRFSKLYSTALNEQLQNQVALLEEGRKQLVAHVREVSALVRAGSLITSSLNLDQVLSLILEQLAEVVNYDRASIQLLFGRKLTIIAAQGFREPNDVLGIGFDPTENALTRRLLNGDAPIVLEDVHEEPAFVAGTNDPTRSWIGVPLMSRNEVFGALTLDKHEPAFYDEEDGQTVLAFANQAAVAIQNARLHDRAREQDVLQERNRLARELHDSLSQSLFSMVLNAEAAGIFFDTEPERARAQIQLLYETANAALKEMRTLIFELRPADLEQEGLAAVLSKHAKMVADRYGITVRVDVRGRRRLPLPVEKALFRVAQEALNNVVKHAQASEVAVTLSAQDDLVALTIEDNGVGIEPQAARPNTLGLTSMRERAEQLGGHFEIGPSPAGVGTLVRVTVPSEQ